MGIQARGLGGGLASLAARLGATEAAMLCGPAAKVLADAMQHTTVANLRRLEDLAEGLTSLAARLDAAEAAKVCGPAAKVLAEALVDEKNANVRRL